MHAGAPTPERDTTPDPRLCPVCLGASFRFRFHEIGHDYERCRGCGFERMRDAASPGELDAYYVDEVTHGRAAWSEHAENVAKFDRVLARIERRVRPGRLLDVGCSLGSALVAARQRGWKAVGIELSRPAAEYGRAEWGLDIRTEHLEELAFPDASFDVVWMHHTLEHVPAPDALIAESRRILARDGLMYQALPNHGGAKSRLLGRFWSYGITSEHVSHFSAATLRRLLERQGLRVVEAWTKSYAADPRLLYDSMRRLGQLPRLERWCTRAYGRFDQEAYIRLITDRRLPHWICNGMWPARLTELLGIGEEAHLFAARG